MNKIVIEKSIAFINFTIVIYFALIYLINYYNVDSIILGVIREIMTIPFLLAQMAFLIIGIKLLLSKKKLMILTTASILVLFVCFLATVISFF